MLSSLKKATIGIQRVGMQNFKTYLCYNLTMKTLLIFGLFFAILMLSAPYALALEIPNPILCSTIPNCIDKIATWLLGIGATIGVIIVLYAAFLFMTSGGSAERVTMARKTLLYAIIGITLLLLAKGVTALIENILKGNF